MFHVTKESSPPIFHEFYIGKMVLATQNGKSPFNGSPPNFCEKFPNPADFPWSFSPPIAYTEFAAGLESYLHLLGSTEWAGGD